MSLILKNGVLVGSANVTAIIGGVIITGIKDIDVQMSQDKANEYGFQKEPIGRTRSQKKYPDAKFTILLEEWKSIVAAAANRDPFQIPMFSIPIVYDDNILPSDTMNNCEFMSVGRQYKAGDGALWLPVGIIYAGLNQ